MYHGSKVLTNDRNIANEFNCYFASNFNQQIYNLNPNILYSDTYPAAIRTVELLQDICEAEILDTISATKRSSAVVFDQFLLKLLHLCPRFFASVLVSIFFSIILTHFYPDTWKTSYVKPLHKTDSKIIFRNTDP